MNLFTIRKAHALDPAAILQNLNNLYSKTEGSTVLTRCICKIL